MLAPLDIFKMQNGSYVWKAAAEAEELGPGTYMIFSQTTSNKTVLTLDDSTERQAAVKS